MAKILIMALFAAGMMLGMAGMASASAITCGGCHSTPPVDSDNCAGDARGLHGVHYNYSSTGLPKSAATTDKCAYCHTATTGTAPTATHNDNFVNVTASAKAPGLSYDFGTSTCTNACHKNESSTAKWGNYTSVATIKLTCNSCHDDSSASAMDLSGAHSAHLGTGITTGTTLDGAGNAKCDACHPDNTSDFWKDGQADDGSVKAYPHASDGTDVATDNAMLDAGISATRNAGAADTCATACHANAATDVWNSGTLTCNSCHYENSLPTFSGNSSASVKLGGSHGPHFGSTIGGMTAITCSNCHSVPGAGDTAHVTALPPVADNAALIVGVSFNDAANTCATACHTNLTTDVWGAASLDCNSCHNATDNAATNNAANVPLGGSHSAHFSAGKTCTNCHGTAPTDTSHASSFPITPDNATITLAYGTWTVGTHTCTNPGDTALGSCHTNDVVWGSTLSCNSCHSYPDGANNWAANNGHAVQYDTGAGIVNTHLQTAAFYNVSTDTYNAVTADPNKCGKCHYGLTESVNHHRGDGITVVPSGNNYCGTGDFTATVTASGSNVTCSSVSCHSGKTTPNWW